MSNQSPSPRPQLELIGHPFVAGWTQWCQLTVGSCAGRNRAFLGVLDEALRFAAIRTSLQTVKNLRTSLLLLTLLGLPLSGMAMLGADCSALALSSSAEMSAHAGHAAENAENADASDGACPCCGGCAAACATGCGNAVFMSVTRVAHDAGNAFRAPASTRYSPDPAPPVPKRPPILPR